MANGFLMKTRSGRKVDPLNLKAEDVCLEDIAHALSNLCRFSGHVETFYSVAEHSIRVADIVPPAYKLQGLLHDATKAYLGDLIRPIKYQLPRYLEAEKVAWIVIAERFNIQPILHSSVKEADEIMLHTEAIHLMGDVSDWEFKTKPLALKYDLAKTAMSPQHAKQLFIETFQMLDRRPR